MPKAQKGEAGGRWGGEGGRKAIGSGKGGGGKLSGTY